MCNKNFPAYFQPDQRICFDIDLHVDYITGRLFIYQELYHDYVTSWLISYLSRTSRKVVDTIVHIRIGFYIIISVERSPLIAEITGPALFDSKIVISIALNKVNYINWTKVINDVHILFVFLIYSYSFFLARDNVSNAVGVTRWTRRREMIK